jgi:SSS family solute:Na+ symporter
MAIASYEWMAAITLVVVAFFFLPYFLKTGIFTIPQFLEHRYNPAARTLMAVATMILLIGVSLTGVIYAGALTMSELFASYSFFGHQIGLTEWCWVIGMMAAVYVAAGGLKASAWADLIQGIALILGGVLIAYFAMTKLGETPVAALTPGSVNPDQVADSAGGFAKLLALNRDKMTMVLPRGDLNIPWTALIIGLWIPNFYYWGQPVHHPAHPRFGLPARGAEGHRVRGGDEADHPLHHRHPRHHRLQSVQQGSRGGAGPRQRAHDRARSRHERIEDRVRGRRGLDGAQPRARREGGRPQRSRPRGRRRGQGGRGQERLQVRPSLNLLIKNLIPQKSGLVGFVLAALLGAIVSSLAAVLNAASTIFTMDIYQQHVNKAASQSSLVGVGRICVGVFA